METTITKRSAAAAGFATAVGIVGLAMTGFALMWVAGTLGISAAAASQIVSAIRACGWVLTVVMAVFGGGIIGALTATVRYLAGQIAKSVAIA